MITIWVPKRLVEIDLYNVAARSPQALADLSEQSYAQRVDYAAQKVQLSGAKIVMLTGPSASGKTTSAHCIAKALQKRGTPAQVVSLDNFFKGAEFYPRLPDGTLDRGCLAARAFATPEGTRRLTDITHPAIIRELLDGVAAAQSTGVPFVFVDGAVIVGEAFEQYCDAIIVVTAPEREAISRIVLRDGISKQAARMRLAAQTPEDVLRAAADYIIANTGDGRHLRAAAQAVLERLLAKETNGTKEKT